VNAVHQLSDQPFELREELPLRNEAVEPGELAACELPLENGLFHFADDQIVLFAVSGLGFDDGNDEGVTNERGGVGSRQFVAGVGGGEIGRAKGRIAVEKGKISLEVMVRRWVGIGDLGSAVRVACDEEDIKYGTRVGGFAKQDRFL
jgi:hypothetical protein